MEDEISPRDLHRITGIIYYINFLQKNKRGLKNWMHQVYSRHYELLGPLALHALSLLALQMSENYNS